PDALFEVAKDDLARVAHSRGVHGSPLRERGDQRRRDGVRASHVDYPRTYETVIGIAFVPSTSARIAARATHRVRAAAFAPPLYGVVAGDHRRIPQRPPREGDVGQHVIDRTALMRGPRFRAPTHQLFRVHARTLAAIGSSETVVRC